MTSLTVWQTGDCCPSCGNLLRQTIQPDGSITDECGCGWQTTWHADPAGGDQ